MGTYAFKATDTSEDKQIDHEFDRLDLRPDGKHVLVQGGSTKPKLQSEEVWNLVNGTQQPNIELDHAGYPVEMMGGQIRLLINDDLRESHVKAK